MGVSARDFVNARLKKVLPDGTIIVVWPAGDTGRAGPVRLLVPHSGSAMFRFTTTLCGQVHNCVDHPYDGPNKPVRGKHHDTGYIIQPVRDSGVRVCAVHAAWLTAAGGACGHGRDGRQVNESSCRVWWIIQTDIGGWVGFVNVRSITGQQMVQLLNNLKKYAEQA